MRVFAFWYSVLAHAYPRPCPYICRPLCLLDIASSGWLQRMLLLTACFVQILFTNVTGSPDLKTHRVSSFQDSKNITLA